MQVESRKGEEEEIETRNALPWEDSRVLRRYRLRKILDKTILAVTVLTVIAVLYPLMDILVMFFYRGALAISVQRLTGLTLDFGLANSIVGTLLLVSLSTAVAVPLGVLGGIFLAEFSEGSAWARKYAGVVRFVSDVLSGMPSILLGYIGFLILTVYFGWGLSPLAGSVILAILMFPYVIKTTELSIRKVPLKLREASSALGATKTQTVNRMSFPLAFPGILTGIILSISISIGETAPLYLTVGFSNYYPCGLTNCQVGYLTWIVFKWALIPNTPGYPYQDLAFLAAFVLISFIIALNLTARIGLRRLSRI